MSWSAQLDQATAAAVPPPAAEDRLRLTEHHTPDVPQRADGWLQLLTPKPHHFLNSTFANMPRHRRAQDSPTLHLHPDDASYLCLTDGSLVDIANEQASVRGTLCITDDVLSGVATLPGQWWSEDMGRTGVNGLALAAWTPAGQPAYNDIHVTVRPVGSRSPA